MYSSQLLGGVIARLGDGAPETVFEVASPTGLAVTDTEMYVASHADGTVVQLAAGGVLLDSPVVVAEGLAAPEGLAILPDGDLVVVETGSGDVSRIDVATGETTVLAVGISPTFTGLDAFPVWTQNSVTVAPSGNVYVTSPRDGNVYRILAS